MAEPSAYQTIEDAGARVVARAIITKAQLKLLVYAVVVITFVSVGAVTFSNVDRSSSVSTRDPSDSPVQSVMVFPITRAPTPSPAPTPTPPSTVVSTNGAPQGTPTRPTPRPSPSTPPASPPTGDSSQAFASGVDLSDKDGDTPTTSSSSSSSSSSSGSKAPTAAPSLVPSAGADASSSAPTSTPGSNPPSPAATAVRPGSPSTTAPQGSASTIATPAPQGTATTTAPQGSASTAAPAPQSNASSTALTTTSTITPQGTTSPTSTPTTALTTTPTTASMAAPQGTTSTPAPQGTTSTPAPQGTTSTPAPQGAASISQPPSGSTLDVTPSSTSTPSRSPSLTPSVTAVASVAPNSVVSTTPASSISAPPTATTSTDNQPPMPSPTSTSSTLMPTTTSSPAATSSSSSSVRLPRGVAPAVVLDATATTSVQGAASRPSDLPTAAIQDGRPASINIVDASNLSAYPDMDCLLPNYVSKDGKMFAVGPAGETHELVIKGVNWFGMETDARIPYGLRTSDTTGSTLYEIAAFLARNTFNSVRLPIAIANVLSNKAPTDAFVNRAANRALDVTSYMTTLQSVVKALAFHHISVLISLDSGVPVTTDDSTDEQSRDDEAAQLAAIDALTDSLCSKTYWNVLGLDFATDPRARTTWGDGAATDARAAATRLGDRMLDGCSKWLAFVQGARERHEWTAPTTGTTYRFDDWQGAGLSNAVTSPVTLTAADKVVYVPHYGSPSVEPASYFYDADGVSELSDKVLQENVRGTFDVMIGHLAKAAGSPSVVLGSFGGLYTSDKHLQKTTQRAFASTVELVAATDGIAGGYVWSLNPESGFAFNAAHAAPDSPFREGLVQADWRTANEPLLAALERLDAMPGLRKLQCIKTAFRLRRQ